MRSQSGPRESTGRIYTLAFWDERTETALDPQDVYRRLCESERVEGLAEIPADRIMARFSEEFDAGWERHGPNRWVSPQGWFEVATAPQCFRVDSEGLPPEDMNRFIAIGQEFDCPWYNAITGDRMDD